MISRIEIHTPRLLLKSITPELIIDLFETKSREEVIAFFNTDDNGYDHLKSMYEKGMETHRLSLFYFLLYDKQNNSVIGDCGYHTWNRTHRRAELFYGMRDDLYKRKGFMKEALGEILRYGFTHLDLHRIEALTAIWNIASIRLLEHYGFKKEGTMREDYMIDGLNQDSECYSLLKWEWQIYGQL